MMSSKTLEEMCFFQSVYGKHAHLHASSVFFVLLASCTAFGGSAGPAERHGETIRKVIAQVLLLRVLLHANVLFLKEQL